MQYEQMLDRLYMSLPEKSKEKSRLEIPPAISSIQGKQTIFKNIALIAKAVSRDVDKMAKYIVKELGAPGNLEGTQLNINAKFMQLQVQKSVNNYMKEYVICAECGRPDTKFESKGGVKVLKCTACGAIKPIKRI